ncbi:hypothetical protein [Enterococcus sp. DIV2324]|uniref:hypothetical protein n=1 Tax=Enterococcus sp. DIV2324 TaxID=2774763 RepID=UPI003F229D00
MMYLLKLIYFIQEILMSLILGINSFFEWVNGYVINIFHRLTTALVQLQANNPIAFNCLAVALIAAMLVMMIVLATYDVRQEKGNRSE